MNKKFYVANIALIMVCIAILVMLNIGLIPMSRLWAAVPFFGIIGNCIYVIGFGKLDR